MNTKSIVLGGGCFWCLEASYQLLDGVIDVVSGYAGGISKNPTYESVSSGTSDHVEVVKVTYDPSVITTQQLLAVFWTIHDPTSLNQQGADRGPQYASVIYYADDEQRQTVMESLDEAQATLAEPIVTRVEPLEAFYVAEEYHQDYYKNNQFAGYCQAVIDPKLAKLRQHFSSLLSS